MAQPVFDDHPIEEYLREAGEVPDIMPGGLFISETELNQTPIFARVQIPQWIYIIVQTIKRFIRQTGTRRRPAATEFAERFKYHVISSSLLSVSLCVSSGQTSKRTDGRPTSSIMTPSPTSRLASRPLAMTLACLLPAAFSRGNVISGIFLLAAIKVLSTLHTESAKENKGSWNTTLEKLEALVNANDAWEETVSDSFKFLEEEEEDLTYTSCSSSEAFRMVIFSTLATIQTQCDDVRQLFTALTSPFAISQLSHMYAPPSPSVTPPSTGFRRSASISSPSSPRLSTKTSEDAYTSLHNGSSLDKRATWNGAYTAPTRKLRSNLSTFISFENVKTRPASEVIKPTPTASGVTAHTPPPIPDFMPRPFSLHENYDKEEPFGVTALHLRRRRKPAHLSLSPRERHQNTLLTSSIGSRFTSLEHSILSSSKSPPSLETLNISLQATLGAKRFACAHLLALRFADTRSAEDLTEVHRKRRCRDKSIDSDSDEEYWEDVRSLIDLLTLAFLESSSRLRNALEEVTRQYKEGQERTQRQERNEERRVWRIDDQMHSGGSQSFAPMPNQLSRFSMHANLLLSSLGDAKNHLDECLFWLNAPNDSDAKAGLKTSLDAYNRLRRELGLALREWERGKAAFHALLEPSQVVEIERDDAQEQEVPRQDEQLSSGESETLFNVDEEHKDVPILIEIADLDSEQAENVAIDDAPSHLLGTSSVQDSPAFGFEEVFEADSAPTRFSRPRSTLSREERIALARSRRGNKSDVSEDYLEGRRPVGLGPSGEVVAELKDVIWKVTEQRRRMTVSRMESAS